MRTKLLSTLSSTVGRLPTWAAAGLGVVALALAVIGVTTVLAEVRTDKFDYAPGETVAITGDGMAAGEAVLVEVFFPDESLAQSHEVAADEAGNFSDTYVLPDDAPGGIYLVVATGLTSGATFTTTFDPAGIGQPGTCTSDPSAVALSQTSIQVSWTDGCTDESDFHIERGSPAGSGAFAEIEEPPVAASPVSDGGLTCGTEYEYRIRAHKHSNDNFDEFSDLVSATTQACPTSTPTDTPTSTPTDTPTSTPTDTPTSTPTDTPTSTPTDTPTSTPTDTPTPTPTPTPVPEGCSPGYWKNNLVAWPPTGYSTGDSFETIFGGVDSLPLTPSLLQVLNAMDPPRGGVIALARQSVAALLNAGHPVIDPTPAFDTTTKVIDFYLANYNQSLATIRIATDQLKASNGAGCPINAQGTPIPTRTPTGTPTPTETATPTETPP